MARPCPCPDPANDPDDLCCPENIELGNYVDVRDRTCKKRKIRPGTKGILAAKSNKTGFLDGSAEQPVNMDIEQVLASNGYIVVQDVSGRILAIKPDATLAANNTILQLVYTDGVWKAVPINFSNQTINDDEITTVKSGVLAAIACAGAGKVKIGKYLPDCITVDGELRYITIDINGNITCDTQAVGSCAEVTAVDELDSLWGCVGGVMTPILPVVGKKLIGIAGPKWGLEDADPATTYLTTPFLRYTYTVIGTAPSSQSATLDLTTVPSYNAAFTEVMIDTAIEGIVQTADYSMNVDIDGVRNNRLDLTANLQSMANNTRGWWPIRTVGSMALALTYNLSLAGSFNRFIFNLYVVAFK